MHFGFLLRATEPELKAPLKRPRHRCSQGGQRGHAPPLKFLENIVILCFERRFSKQNSVIRWKSNISATPKFFAPPNFWAGYATGPRYYVSPETQVKFMSLQKHNSPESQSSVRLQVSGNTLQQVEKFKHLRVVFTSGGRQNKVIDIRLAKANVVLREIYRSAVTQRELSNTANLSVFKSVCSVPHLWSWILVDYWKRAISSVSGRDGFFAKILRRDTSWRSAQLWNSYNPESRATSPNRDPSRTLVRPCVQNLSLKIGEASYAGYTDGKRPKGRPRGRWRDYFSNLS